MNDTGESQRVWTHIDVEKTLKSAKVRILQTVQELNTKRPLFKHCDIIIADNVVLSEQLP